jgi:hypothetical protein
MGNTLSTDLFEDTKEESPNPPHQTDKPKSDKKKRKPKTLRRRIMESVSNQPEEDDADIYGDHNHPGNYPDDSYLEPPQSEPGFPSYKKKRRQVTYKSRNNYYNL